MTGAPDNSFKPLTLDDNSFRTSTTGAPPVVPPNQQGAFTQGAPTPDAFTLPSYSKSEQLQVNPAQYTWNPGDEGFGQGQVQKYGFDTGMVPVAEMKLPFGALAARGDSLAKREAANLEAQQKVKEKFDPYGGIGKAADPFQPAFGKYGMSVLNKLAADITEAYGGDEAEAWNRISTPGTQENQLWLQKSREISDVGTANQYEFKQYADLYADVLAGKQKVDPETREALRKFLSAQNELGIPVDGVDPAEFRSQRQDLEGMISAESYMKNFMTQLPNMVQSVAQELGKAMPVGGGRYALQDLAKKEFEPALRVYAQEYSDTTGGRVSPEEAYEKFSKVFNDELERKTATWSPRADGAGSGSGGSEKGQRFTAATSRPPQGLTGIKIDPLGGGQSIEKMDWPTINLFDIVNKRGQTPFARVFTNETGDNVYMHPTRIMDFAGQKYIIGKETAMPRAESGGGSGSAGFDPNANIITDETVSTDGDETTVNIQTFNQLPDIAIPYNQQNAALIEGSFGLPVTEVDRMLASVKVAPRTSGTATAAPGYKIGQVDDGYKYIGGDPTKPESWKKVN